MCARATQAYAVGADFSGADMTNAVVDRVDFNKANLSRARFNNAVITGATFEGTNLDGAVFEDALIGGEDVKRLWVAACWAGLPAPHTGARALWGRSACF